MAGTTNMHESGRWWTDQTKMVGVVNHENNGKKWESKYAIGIPNSIHDVCIIDGVFISLHKNRINKKFDENVNGFHFYDITFCTENFLSGCKIGVIYDIRITHKSIGMTNNSWEENRKSYVSKYEKNLPFSILPNINYNFIKYEEPKLKFNLVVQSSNDEKNTINFFESLKKLNIFENIIVFLISTDTNIESLKKYENKNVKIYEGFFESLNKNLSILKWDDSFMQLQKDLIFFCTDKTIILNNVFSSMYEIYKKEKNIFGCVFPSVINEKDNTIFSNGLDLLINKEEKINLILKHQFSYYNIFHGHFKNFYGNISDFFATTLQNLKSLDWFDINYETFIFNLDFSIKMELKKHKSFIDTNSVILYNVEKEQLLIDEELKRLLNQSLNIPQVRENLKKIK